MSRQRTCKFRPNGGWDKLGFKSAGKIAAVAIRAAIHASLKSDSRGRDWGLDIDLWYGLQRFVQNRTEGMSDDPILGDHLNEGWAREIFGSVFNIIDNVARGSGAATRAHYILQSLGHPSKDNFLELEKHTKRLNCDLGPLTIVNYIIETPHGHQIYEPVWSAPSKRRAMEAAVDLALKRRYISYRRDTDYDTLIHLGWFVTPITRHME